MPRPSSIVLATVLALLVLLPTAVLIDVPGYTDADYYYSIALRLARGEGLTQPFLWNYLAEPAGLPQPAHLYWMPFTSMAAALPMLFFGEGFRIAQGLFVLLAALLPMAAFTIARHMQASDRQALAASVLAVFPGFFLPFFVTTDSFVLFALLGSAALLMLANAAKDPRLLPALTAGALIGLCHLTRADGLLLLLPAAWAMWKSKSQRFGKGLALLVGYLLLIGPWMIRLTAVSGTPFPPGASRALWLRGYDEIFSYPADFLTPSYLLDSGWTSLLQLRLEAFGSNALSFLAVNNLVFLLPLVVVGGWHRRHRLLVQLGVIYWSVLLIAMSFLFPFPGARGGYFHSSAALMPLIWALAPIGLDRVVSWASGKRGWETAKAAHRFTWGMVAIAAATTGFLFWQRLVNPVGAWGRSHREYRQVGSNLRSQDDDVGLVAVNNPPGFWLATGLPSVVIPNGDVRDLIDVASEFGVEWVILEVNHPAQLDPLYHQPRDFDELQYVLSLTTEVGSPIHFFQLVGDS